MDNKTNSSRTSSSRSSDDAEVQPVTKKTRTVHQTIIYDESKPNQWLDDPPLEIWDHVIIPMLGLKDLALSRHVCTFFEAYWQNKFANNVLPLRIDHDVSTIDQAMQVMEILSSRRDYTKASPLVVLLGKGEHAISSSWTDERGNEIETTFGISHSNITFIGTGKNTTTILGGFAIYNIENILFKQMTVTNTTDNGCGIHMSHAKVELFDVAVKGCANSALIIPHSTSETILVATRCEFANSGLGAIIQGSLTSATFNNCVFYNNNAEGFIVSDEATTHLHGEATAIHSNVNYGIIATTAAKVRIHLPSHHNTFYNNGKQDRKIVAGGTITNIED